METIKRQCQVVLRPTNEKAIIGGNKYYATKAGCGELKLRSSMSESFINSFWKNPWTNYNLHITSDEEINEGDWILDTRTGRIAQNINTCIKKFNDAIKKIISSTNPSLGLPQPSTAFIEKYISEYNKNNIIEKVMVEYDGDYDEYYGGYYADTVKPKVSKDNTITISKVKDSWSREEIEKLLDNCWDAAVDYADKVIKMNYGLCNDEPTFTDKASWIDKNL